MLRIIAGSAKGAKLKTPTWKGTRPMTDKVRGALFNVLGDFVIDTKVLDLFAGTGAVGIEALSRGARFVDFVDLSRKCCRLIGENLASAGFGDRAKVQCRRAEDFLKSFAGQQNPIRYDVIFFCPPYADFSFVFLSAAANLLAPEGVIVAEMASRDTIDILDGLTLWQMKEYGDTRLLFLEKSS